MNTQDRITGKTTDTSMGGLNRARRCLATIAAFSAAALLTAVAHAANVSEIDLSSSPLNSSAYVKVAEGTLEDTLSLCGITAFNGTEQVDFVCVSNRPYETSSSAISGLPSGSYVHQLSVFNNWDGSRTRSLRVQLAQPEGTTDIYARIPCVTISQEGVNLVDYPDIRNLQDDASKIEGSYTDDTTIALYPVSKLLLRHIDDPYIEADGTSGISTGYRMKGTSRLEVDFALTEQTEQVRLFGDDANHETSLNTVLYVSGGSSHFAITTGNGTSTATRYKAGTDTVRHTAIVDLPNDQVSLLTDGASDLDNTTGVSGGFSGIEASMPLPLFGRWGNDYASSFANCAKARIYGVKIYENNVLVRDFVPCLKDGVACFKDLVGGGFIVGEDTSAFTAGGDVPTYDDDAYVSTAANAVDGKLYVDTGYKVSAKTAVALDCAVTGLNTRDGFFYLFSCSGGTKFGFDINRWNGKLRYSAGGNSSVETFATSGFLNHLVYDVRRTFLLDNLNTMAAVVTSGFTNQTTTFTVSTSSAANGTNLQLATEPWKSGNYAAIKIYGCKIWEDGVLVRDFVPYVDNGTVGLRDEVTGAFIAGSDKSGGGNALAYGGAIAGEQDAYLESNGTTGLDTGYKMKGTSRLEMDFALTTTNGCAQWRVFGSDTQETSLKTYLYLDGSLHWTMREKPLNKYTTDTPDTERHTAVLDLYHGKVCFTTGDATNWSGAASSSYDYSALPEASKTLPILGRYSGDGYALVPKARVYSVRIYEEDALAHEFIPYSRDGVVGLYDTMTGDIVSNGSTFTFDGVGQDHGQLKTYLKPGYSTEVSYGNTVTLTAYAPGATSYRWLMDGEPVDGGTDGTFEVAWANGGSRSAEGYRHTYQAIAVYDDFYGVTREGEPSAVATVMSRTRALIFIVK